MRDLRASIKNKMWCVQKSLLLFQRTSRNRNAPLIPRLQNHVDTNFRGGRSTKVSAKSTERRILLTRVYPPSPASLYYSRYLRSRVAPLPRASNFVFHGSSSNLVSLGTYCGLCGKQGPLILTDCCNRPVCDDQHMYKPFSYSRVSCARNHERYTVCHHHIVEHPEETCYWRDCGKCREDFADVESYVGQGTSHCNFADDYWDDPPSFEPGHCSRCGTMMKLNSEGYSILPDERGSKLCQRCSAMC